MRISRTHTLALTLLLSACSSGSKTDPSHVDNSAPGDPAESEKKPKALQADYGVHLESKSVFMGALNDESGGPGSTGAEFANGKRVLARWIASGKSELLPEGWKLELVERDHGSQPDQAARAYKEIKDKVLCFVSSYGEKSTAALLKMLKEDDVLLFPAVVTSTIGSNEYTPPAGPSYRDEALRALDWVQKTAGSVTVVPGAIYEPGSYGSDALSGWNQGTAAFQLSASLDQALAKTAAPDSALEALQNVGATHVLLATSPSATVDILKAGAALDYRPVWLGLSPTWHRSMSSPDGLSVEALARYHLISSAPYFGEALPGMERFLAVWEEFGADFGKPSDEGLRSFIQGMLAIKAFAVALDRNDATRSGYRQALSKVAHFDAMGMIGPMDFSEVPFRASNKTRVLTPRPATNTWSVVGELQSPSLAAKAEELDPEDSSAAQPEGEPSQPDSVPTPPVSAGVEGSVPPAADSATASEVK
jgi:ABC-type branched-subunit amino acid transport system substrate-binding protein